MKIEITLPEVNMKKGFLSLKTRAFSALKADRGRSIFNMVAFFSTFAFTFLAISGLHIFESSYADTTIAAIVTQNGYYINATSDSLNGSINMNVNSTPDGTMAIAKDTLNVKSNVPEGYNIYISMGRNDDCTTNCNALKKEGSTSAIAATNGTFSSPKTLSANTRFRILEMFLRRFL